MIIALNSLWKFLVGSSGLEPPTSRLSGARSSLLSYEPISSRTCHLFVSLNSPFGGDDGIRTHDPLLAGQVLSQLSYTPVLFRVSGLFAFRTVPKNWTTIDILEILVFYLGFSISKTILYGLHFCASVYVDPSGDQRFSIERRWSSRTFRYGYLVTT